MWLTFALFAAFANAAYGLEQKRISNKEGSIFLSITTRLWSLPLIVVALILLPNSWRIQQSYWTYLLICSSLTALGTYLTYYAYKKIDFSLVFPMLNLTPAIALLASWVIDGTKPTFIGLIGVSLIVAGSYWLTSSSDDKLSAPFKHLINNKGVWAIITVAALYAVTTSYDKLGVAASTPIVWTLGLNVAMAIILVPFLFLFPSKKSSSKKVSKQNRWIIAIFAGSLVAPTMLFQMYALKAGGYVPFVLAIKQLSVIIAVIASWHLLKEKPDKVRLWSAVIMSVGAIIIGLS